MIVLCCGDRNWTNSRIIKVVLKSFGSGPHIIIHGAARGADSIAGEIAEGLGYQVKAYPANWEAYGRAAGPIRNRLMLSDNPDVERVYAFHNDLLVSRGTRDMVNAAREKKIWVGNVKADGSMFIAI